MDVRVSDGEFRTFKLEAHELLAGVPLRDVSAIDLPGGGPGRTLADVRSIVSRQSLTGASPAVRLLFKLRVLLGRAFRWDRPEKTNPSSSYAHRLSPEVRARSVVPTGTPDGPFQLLYVLENESLAELQNATVHAFLASVLRPTGSGYRLYWAVYVQPVSRLTGLYMALIEPFRRFIVYPAIFRSIRRAWQAHNTHSPHAAVTDRPDLRAPPDR